MKTDQIKDMNLILASASPRRIEIFNNHNLFPTVMPSDADENIPIKLTPAETVMFLSLQKSLWTIKNNKIPNNSIIVSADTIVVFGNKILGKPANERDAFDMLSRMSGKSHSVYTGVCIHTVTNGCTCFFDKSDVVFCDIPKSELLEYIKTDEPYDKAGGYGIQETFSKYAKLISGELDNVIGFPFTLFEKQLNCLSL